MVVTGNRVNPASRPLQRGQRFVTKTRLFTLLLLLSLMLSFIKGHVYFDWTKTLETADYNFRTVYKFQQDGFYSSACEYLTDQYFATTAGCFCMDNGYCDLNNITTVAVAFDYQNERHIGLLIENSDHFVWVKQVDSGLLIANAFWTFDPLDSFTTVSNGLLYCYAKTDTTTLCCYLVNPLNGEEINSKCY